MKRKTKNERMMKGTIVKRMFRPIQNQRNPMHFPMMLYRWNHPKNRKMIFQRILNSPMTRWNRMNLKSHLILIHWSQKNPMNQGYRIRWILKNQNYRKILNRSIQRILMNLKSLNSQCHWNQKSSLNRKNLSFLMSRRNRMSLYQNSPMILRNQKIQTNQCPNCRKNQKIHCCQMNCHQILLRKYHQKNRNSLYHWNQKSHLNRKSRMSQCPNCRKNHWKFRQMSLTNHPRNLYHLMIVKKKRRRRNLFATKMKIKKMILMSLPTILRTSRLFHCSRHHFRPHLPLLFHHHRHRPLP
jgi:hypothetical protein